MKLLMLAMCLCLASCYTDPDGLTVKQYHLRENMFRQNNDLMARGEVQRLLHGAVTVEERRKKVGQYYHVIWIQPKNGEQAAEVVFEYLQAGSGSKVQRMVQRAMVKDRLDSYFEITGDNYFRKGRVLAWRCSIRIDGQEVASKRSYMWR
jgi:hypothetical protein